MPASPLAAAMLGNENPAMIADPSIIAAMPDIQLGQSMQQAGMSGAPAYPAQAAGRLAQALAGAFIQQSATSNLAKAYANTADALSKAFDPKDPIQKFLNSDNPIVRGMGAQAAQKILTLKSDPYSLEPQQTRQINGAVVGTGSPELAGNVAKARAPYEAGGEAVVNGPNGPQEIPITAATRAAMQLQAQRPANFTTPVSPSAAIPPPAPKPQAPPAPNNATSESAAPKDQSRVAAQNTSVSGKPLPNPAIEPAVKADTEELSKDREAALKGQQEMATVRAFRISLPR
jgi:hypothetical protein